MKSSGGTLRGRDEIQRDLLEWLERVIGGNAGVLHLEGVTGVGKTALVDWLEAHAEQAGMRTLRVVGHPEESDTAWAGLSQLVAPHLRRLDHLDERPRATLRRTMRLGDRGRVDQVSVGMALLLLLTTTDHNDEQEPHLPTLVVVDDLQWVDPASADVLRFVARRLQATGIGIITAAHPNTAMLIDSEAGHRRRVDALDEQHLRAMARDLGAVDAVARTLAENASGLPLIVHQMIDALAIEQLTGREPLSEPVAALGRVDELLVERMAGLPDDARRLLAAAALAPSLGLCDLALAVGIAAASDQASDTVRLAAAEAVAAQLVTLSPTGIDFAHPTVRTAAIGALSDDERRSLHLELARHSDVQHAGWHLAAATTEPDDVAAAALDALADDAEGRGAHLVALRARQTAISTAATPDPRRILAAARAAVAARLPDLALELLESSVDGAAHDLPGVISVRAEAAWITGDVDRARRLWSQVALDGDAPRDLRRSCRRRAAMAAFRMYDTPGVSELTAGMSASDDPTLHLIDQGAAAVSGRPGGARALVSLARQHLDGPSDPATAEVLAQVVTLALARIGHDDELAALSERVTELAAHDAALVVPGLLISRAAYRSRSDLIGASALARQALALADEWGLHEHRPFALAIAAVSEASADVSSSTDLIAQMRAFDIDVAHAVADYATALVHYGREQYAEAAAILTRLHDAHPRRLGFGFFWHGDLVDIALRLGDHETADRVTEDLRAIGERTASPWVSAAICRVTALQAPDRDTAETCFAEGVELFHRHGYVISAARLGLEWVQRLRRERQRARARNMLAPMRETLASAGARRWAERAEREAVALGLSLSQQPTQAGSQLTPRELQVARWLVAGLTYRQIGERLFMSSRTAESHGQAVYRKLGIHRRAELARLAQDDPTLRDTPTPELDGLTG